jgi:hypothetical protein
MKHIFSILLSTIILSMTAQAQFRGEEPSLPSVRDGVYRNSVSNNILGFFNPDNLEMRHSVSVSYGSFGGEGLGMSMYTNSLRYRISEPLSVRADVAMMFSPFGSMASRFQQDLSGIFLRRASVDYRLSKEMQISLQYRNDPYSYYGPYSGSQYGGGRYGSGGYGFGGGMFFDSWDDEDRP